MEINYHELLLQDIESMLENSDLNNEENESSVSIDLNNEENKTAPNIDLNNETALNIGLNGKEKKIRVNINSNNNDDRKYLEVEVNKENLVRKSLYFQIITNPCFVDHKSDILEIKIPVSLECFQEVMYFLTTENININNDNVIEICHLADYFLIDDLKKICLDYFTYNLSKKTINDQITLLGKYHLVEDKFKERALKFKQSSRLVYSGLYIIKKSAAIHFHFSV